MTKGFKMKAFCLSLITITLVNLTNLNAIAQVADSDHFLIIPGQKAGNVSAASTEAELRKIYGKENVTTTEISLGEGETQTGTVLFGGQPNKKAEITWKDSENKKNPAMVRIYGDKSLWKTSEGISLGTTLKELERINGGEFILTGFKWDYQGTVIDWKKGALEKKLNKNGRVLLRLIPNDKIRLSAQEDRAVTGDKPISSKNSVMQKINPQVYEISFEF
jgi:hypothetical protein